MFYVSHKLKEYVHQLTHALKSFKIHQHIFLPQHINERDCVLNPSSPVSKMVRHPVAFHICSAKNPSI